MKRVFNLLAMGLVLFFWFGVVFSLFAPLPSKLNTVLPICGVVIALLHWLQASMIARACKPHFVVTRQEFLLIVLFGVFATADIRARMQAVVDKAQQSSQP
ncbi:hypothetical protein CJP16_20055 [Aeromonas sobria]|uniref:DUF1145 domain-containing protein n=1 Tax=Aeromonas sobria TaxID=646 RepID=A0A2N3IQ51_AERSO|nr:DUF1145 domain-containing protein [Aeromonas sobria]PKQ73413.1 hypothetical protein CJP16_20055 [Aeromonas sobria]